MNTIIDLFLFGAVWLGLGVPERPYQWRAARYPWALRAIERAEAVHGRPEYEVAS